jgi:ATP/maltotriose-dependent transcriptional regulator MalT
MAALAIGGEPDQHRAATRFSGGDRWIADYFVEEVLQRAPAEEVALLTRTSVLDTLTAPACSAVMGAPVTVDDLRALRRRNRFIVLLDPQEERYRHHRLFARMLRGELARREPHALPELHRRAADWHRAQGDHLATVKHLRRGGDDDAAALYVWESLPELQPSGRIETLRRMIGTFPAEEVRARAPLSLAMAWTCVHSRSDMGGHWTRLAAAADFPGPLPGGPAGVDAAIDLLQATIGAGGAAQMARDAARAYEEDDENSPWRSLCCFLVGVGAHLQGNRSRARRTLGEGADRAGSMFRR